MAFSVSISCLVLESFFRFFETCKLDVSDVIYSRIINYIDKMVNISVTTPQFLLFGCNMDSFFNSSFQTVTQIF